MEKVENSKSIIPKLFEDLGNHITLGIPLGAGKPNVFVNELYEYVSEKPDLSLTICTALTLEKPEGGHWLEKRFIKLFSDRIFGDYPNLKYEKDRLSNNLPENINIIEFYFPPGKYLSNPAIQKNYVSSNYTHVCRDMLDRGVNLIAAQVAQENGDISYSCNADVTGDLVKELKKRKNSFKVVMQVNKNLPFMYGQALIQNDDIDFLIDGGEGNFKVFGPPKMSISNQDYMIGLYASTLVKDDGELQVGIGSLGDSVVHGIILKHQKNELYKKVLDEFNVKDKFSESLQRCGYLGGFNEGLFGATEMMVDGFMELYKAGILKKKVYDHIMIQRLINEDLINPDNLKLDDLYLLERRRCISAPLNESDFNFLQYWGFIKSDVKFEDGKNYFKDVFVGEKLKHGHLMHAGFFLGPESFYDWLKELPKEERMLFDMRSVLKINQLFGHEEIDRLHRKNARFINTCMMTTLSGAHVSDGLADGRVVSGVGGQFNFVSQAQELPDGHSILMMKSTRMENGKLKSNIVTDYGHITVPRHMRDILVTEYGIAFLRGKTDREIIIELLKVCDSHFQEELLEKAKATGKIEKSFSLDSKYKNNYSKSYNKILNHYKKDGLFQPFPFGTDLTDEEIKIGKALKAVAATKKMGKMEFVKLILNSFSYKPTEEQKHLLSKLDLLSPKSIEEKILKNCLAYLMGQ